MEKKRGIDGERGYSFLSVRYHSEVLLNFLNLLNHITGMQPLQAKEFEQLLIGDVDGKFLLNDILDFTTLKKQIC